MKGLLQKWNSLNLVPRIVIGLVIGIILAVTIGDRVGFFAILGTLFVGALRAVAPILVFILVIASIATKKPDAKTNMKPLILLYLVGTFTAAFFGVVASFAFPIHLEFTGLASVDYKPPSSINVVLLSLLMNIVDNPIRAIVNGNYIGILAWALIFGNFLRVASGEATKEVLSNISDSVTAAVRLVINFAPLGVMGLVFASITESGIDVLATYGQLLLVLVTTMLVVYFIVNPFIAFLTMRHNPYPLVFRCFRESAITAFFTRSSAANIPVNLRLCDNLGLNRETYSIAVPLGANVAMQGAAITITVMTLSTVHTVGLSVSFASAVLLCFAAALGAAGTSGVPGGSLLLIPVGASVFGIPEEIAMQAVGIGFIISVVQDSCETALNSSSDPLWIGAVEQRRRAKEGQPLLDFRSKKA